MNVSNVPPYVTDAVQNSNAAQKQGSQEKTAVGNNGSSDRVQLSKDYQELASAQKAIVGPPEIRAEKVEQIKNQLQNGTYQVRPAETAGKMVDEII